MLETNDAQSRVKRVNHVLVVDDDPVAGGIMGLRLEELGFEVSSVESGEEALEKLGGLKPDIVLLDVSMPGIGGLEVLDRIRTWRMDAAVIITTAYGTEEIVADALRRGADDYVGKPIEPEALAAVLERIIARLELQRQVSALSHQLQDERTRASFLREDALPKEKPEIPGFELDVQLVPAREMSGDFYNWVTTEDGGLSFTLGDAASTGVPATLLTATVGAALRTASYNNPAGEAVNLASRALKDDTRADANYVPLFHAHLDPETRRLGYVDAGHGHVFVRHPAGHTENLVSAETPFGLIPGEGYVESSLVLEPGDALVVYSDGFFDAYPGGVALDVISDALGDAKSASQMVDRMVKLARLETIPGDDLTVMVLYCKA